MLEVPRDRRQVGDEQRDVVVGRELRDVSAVTTTNWSSTDLSKISPSVAVSRSRSSTWSASKPACRRPSATFGERLASTKLQAADYWSGSMQEDLAILDSRTGMTWTSDMLLALGASYCNDWPTEYTADGEAYLGGAGWPQRVVRRDRASARNLGETSTIGHRHRHLESLPVHLRVDRARHLCCIPCAPV
jgi:hypothetical protein